MNRKYLVVGDAPAPGGAVLPYGGPECLVMGRRAALIGGRAYCEGCNSIGLIAKAGGDYRPGFYGSQIALAGDVVVCQCPHPQPILSSPGSNSRCDDRNTLIAEMELTPEFLVPGRLIVNPEGVMAAQKRVAEDFQHAPEHEPTLETICPNMTNKEFADLVLKLRDTAVSLASERLLELSRWDEPAKRLVGIWFGECNEEVRRHLERGTRACQRVLNELTSKNFIRYSEGLNKNLGCTFGSNADGATAAAVCKPDLVTHTISFGQKFCSLPDDMLIFDTNVRRHGDSRLLTLVHEVTHFDDVFGSFDTWPGTTISFLNAAKPDKRSAALKNADTLAAYILGIKIKP
jgi:uncharacterized Zn-binding protein involved in type VI secretion